MISELKKRLKTSPLEVEEIATITEENLHLKVEGKSIRALKDAEGLVLHLDKAYDCGSAAEAASIVLDHFDVEVTIPRLPRDTVQAIMDALHHDREETISALLDGTPIPKDSYESILHMLVSASRASEEILLREMFDTEPCDVNAHSGYPYPEYYEVDYRMDY